MKDLIDLQGASGAVYRFAHIRGGRPLSPMGGAWLYVREIGDGYELIGFGEVPNLLKDAHEHWKQAVEMYGATDLYTRLNFGQWARQLEHADLAGAIHAPMNFPVLARRAG
jgi:hypothetical protein